MAELTALPSKHASLKFLPSPKDRRLTEAPALKDEISI